MANILAMQSAEMRARETGSQGGDITTGSPKPMGVRGARMADTVGASQGKLQQITTSAISGQLERIPVFWL
jgi:hypothetical protein